MCSVCFFFIWHIINMYFSFPFLFGVILSLVHMLGWQLNPFCWIQSKISCSLVVRILGGCGGCVRISVVTIFYALPLVFFFFFSCWGFLLIIQNHKKQKKGFTLAVKNRKKEYIFIILVKLFDLVNEWKDWNILLVVYIFGSICK